MSDVRSALAARVRQARRGTGVAWVAVRSALAPVGRRAPEIVVGIAVVLSVLAVLVLVGAARNDAAIDADRGVAVGEVLEGSDATVTFVRFTAENGAVLTPDQGVFYPRGLEPGNFVLVEYDRSEPELVRVAERDWTEGLVPVALGIAGLWALLGPLAWYLRRRRDAPAPVAAPAPPRPRADGSAGADPGGRSCDDDREPVGVGR